MTDPARSEQVRAVIVISGKVVGVFFPRFLAQSEGMRLGLHGESPKPALTKLSRAIVEGEKQAVEEFIAWCRKGPPMAQVASVDVRWSPPRGEFRTFVVAR